MSDAFADLWNSSAPSKPVAQKTLAGSGATPQVRVGSSTTQKAQDAFSLLSSRSSSSSSFSTLPTARLNVPSRPTAAPTNKPPNGNIDAFGDLLGSTMAVNNDTSRITIAERAAQAEQQRLAALQKKQQVDKADISAWQGLDSLVGSTFTSSTQPHTIIASGMSNPTLDGNDDDDWGLSDLTGSASASAVRPASTNSQTVNSSQPRTLWDLDDFLTTDTSSFQVDSTTTGRVRLDGQNDGLLGQDEDDILGDLGKPIDALPRSSQNTRTPTPQNAHEGRGSRSISPPPHVLGQIVEMGFSVQQARIALAATDTGLDVQVALETLLSNGAASSSHPPTPRHPSPAPSLPRGHRVRMREQSRSSSSQRDHEQQESNLQEQADKLIAQASEIGLSVLSKASLFWREGKERVQKAYEERTGGNGLLVGGPKAVAGNPLAGRPKWMTEEAGGEHDTTWPKPSNSVPQPQQGIHSEPRASSTRTSQEQPATIAAEADLLSNDTTFYASPWRRGKPKSKPQPEAGPNAGPGMGMPRAPSPIRAVPRANIVSASQSAMSLSTQHKDRGAEKFKLGQYSEAEAAYSSAIAALPESHLLLVPLYNNRALTRLKTGDYTGTVDDTTTAVGIIGSGYHPAREIKVSRPDEGAAIDLADGLVKALKRRAEALEGREKWEEAGKDWEALAAKEWAKSTVRSEAVRGAGRCRRMVQAPSSSSLSSSSSMQQVDDGLSRPKRPTRTVVVSSGSQVPTRPSVALAKLRSANDAAEAEDQARHELKDNIDAKISAWKAKKETNIRALLASLDTVLWPELGLQKVGMAELVSPAQVKIKYTKTIAKLHPDKLNPTNSTVEQRMLANGVFGALSDAWNAFK